jgi:SAM-dependent methyltransferase
MMVDWDRDFFKTGYEGFESPDQFPTAETLENYRRLLLDKTAAQVSFISRHVGPPKLRVFEVGSGNGRLLVGLALTGMLRAGLGIEISRSRVQFAREWAEAVNFSDIIRSVAADALEFEDFEWNTFDLALCITGAFGYFRPIHESAPERLLGKMKRALAPGGHLLLELYQMTQTRLQMFQSNGGRLRTWQPLPSEDRFAYYLDDLEYRSEQRILRHGKIFIGRNGVIDAGRVEMLAYYRLSELADLLQENGFSIEQAYAGFDDAPYREGESSSLVLLASRFE